jgi:hypothetical protein
MAAADVPITSKSLATYTFTSSGWATFGIVLPRGEAFTGLQAGGLPTQVDVKNRWPDGSIRYAILTALIVDTGSYDICESGPVSGGFAPVVPTASLALNIEGAALYTSELPSAASADLWLDGPLVKEWRIRDIPKHNGVEHPFLSNIWDVRVYNDGTGTVDVTVENIRDVAVAGGVVYGVEITVDGELAYCHAMSRPGKNPITYVSGSYGNSFSSIGNELIVGNYIRFTSGAARGAVGLAVGYSGPLGDIFDLTPRPQSAESIIAESWETVFFHQYGARWHKILNIGGFKKASVILDFEPFIVANAIPKYMPSISNAAVSRENGDFEGAAPLSYSVLAIPMGITGGKAELGPYTAWAARYIVHQTPELLELNLSLGDISGSWAMHYTKNDPSKIITLDEKPNYWLDERAAVGDKPLNNMRGSINRYLNSHAPSLAYIPYLITGGRYYSDEMLFRASHAVLSTYTGYPEPGAVCRNGTEGMLWNNQLRGIAWSLRDLTDAAFYLPDASLYKSYFATILGSNLNGMDEHTKKLDSPLGFIGFGRNLVDRYVQIAPWQYAYFAWAMQHAIEQGEASLGGAPAGSVTRDSAFRSLFEPAIIDTDFPPEYLAGYYVNIGTRIGTSGILSEFFRTWKEVYESNYVNDDGSPMPIPAWGYGADLHIAAIAAKKAGYPGADKAYSFIVGMSDRSTSKFMNNITSIWGQFAFADVPMTIITYHITGAVLYQDSPISATISLYNNQGTLITYTDTADDGAYALSAPATAEDEGYTLVVTKPGYLSYTIKNLILTNGLDIETIDIRQLAGDVNGDGIVNAVDLTLLLSEFNRSPPTITAADIDGNGIVNAADLTYLLAGFNKRDVIEIRN